MDVLYVSVGCPGCDRVMQFLARNPRIRPALRWAEPGTAALDELIATGATAKPALVADVGTPFARLYVGAGPIEQVLASRYR